MAQLARFRVKDGVCPSCGQYAIEGYQIRGAVVCGFCYGIGPDGTDSQPISTQLATFLNVERKRAVEL